MNAPDRHQCDRIRPLLPGYLLDTLSRRARNRVQNHLQQCPTCRDALQLAQNQLGALESLPNPPPPQGLAERTLLYIDHKETQPSPITSFIRDWRYARRPLATAASLLLIPVILAVFSLLVGPSLLSSSREAARASSCQNNLKQLGLAFKMYARESKDNLYPPPAIQDRVWTFDLRVLYPEYITAPDILVCPSDPEAPQRLRKIKTALEKSPPDYATANRLVARSYTYTGYALATPQELQTFLNAKDSLNPETANQDINTPNGPIRRFREITEPAPIPAIEPPGNNDPSKTPLLFETSARANELHPKNGINVLYEDGHPAFLPYPGDYPATPDTAQAFPPPQY